MLQFTPRGEERGLFAIFEENYASVYGGYIRDVLRGAMPNDLDVVVERNYAPRLDKALKQMGYCSTEYDEANGTWLYVHGRYLKIDLFIEEEFTHHDTILSPVTKPDFDVNTLIWAYNGTLGDYNLSSWSGLDAAEIVQSLEGRQRIAMMYPNTPSDRIKKIERDFIIYCL